MDKPKFHVTQGGIDAFVTVRFAGMCVITSVAELCAPSHAMYVVPAGNKKAKTKKITKHGAEDLHMAFNEELWMPVRSAARGV